MSQPAAFSLASSVRLLWRHAAPYKRELAVVALVSLLDMFLNAQVSLSFKFLIDTAIGEKNGVALAIIVGSLVASATLVGMAQLWRDRRYAAVTSRIIAGIRTRLFAHLQKLSLNFYSRTQPGDLVARFANDLSEVEDTILNATPSGIIPLLDALLSTVLIFALDWRLAMLALLAFPLAMAGPHILSPRTAAAAYQRKQQEAELLSSVQDNIVAQPLVKAYGLDSRAIAAFLTRNSVLERNSANLGFLTLSMERSAEMTSTVLQIAVLAGGGYLAYRGEMSVGTLAAFQAIFVTLTTSLAELGRYIPEIVHSSGGLARIEEILVAKPRVQDKPDAVVMDTSAPPHIEFRGVTFSYTGTSKTIDNVNLTIPHGQYAAFVGPSGSGKSTILTLALRFYDPLAGSICIGGQDIRSVTQDSLRARMAVVLQDNMLFRISVRENIRCARPGATDEEVEYAAMQAGIHDFILGLPNGYDTRAGGRRGRFSGGQRQRLAIARALLRNPEILLLDEATSALDSATEAKINETIERIAKGRTVISVTHRLAAATKADCIYYMEDGKLVESGSHQELLARNGAYAALWRKQTQETPPAPAAAATAAI